MLKQLIFILLCSIFSINAMEQEIKTNYEKISDEVPVFASKHDLKNYHPLSYSIHCNPNIPEDLKKNVLIYLENRACQRIKTNELFDHSYINNLFFFDENTIVAGFEDGFIEIWDILNNKLIKKFQGHKKPIASFLKVNENLISFSRDEGLIKEWNINTGTFIKKTEVKKNQIIHNVSFDETSQTIKVDTIDFSLENAKLNDIKFSENKFSNFGCCTIL